METSIKAFQREIADILNADPWYLAHGVRWLPENALDIEFEIKKSLGQTGMVAVVTTPELNYQGEAKKYESRQNFEEHKVTSVTFNLISNNDPSDVRTVTLDTDPSTQMFEGGTIHFSKWLDGEPIDLVYSIPFPNLFGAVKDNVAQGFIPPSEGTMWHAFTGLNDEYHTDDNPFSFGIYWTIPDEQGREITIKPTSEPESFLVSGGCWGDFSAEVIDSYLTIIGNTKYTAELEWDEENNRPKSIKLGKVTGDTIGKPFEDYVEWVSNSAVDGIVPYVNTGRTPDGDTNFTVTLASVEDNTAVVPIAGSRSAPNMNTFCVGFYTDEYSGAANRSKARYDWGANSTAKVALQSFSRFPLSLGFENKYRIMNGVGDTDQFGNVAPVLNEVPIYLFGWNTNNTTVTRVTTPMSITGCVIKQGESTVTNLVPVVREGVGYFYDTVTKQLFGSANEAPLTPGTVVPHPTTSDSSNAVFTETVAVVNKGFDATISLQIVENPTVNRGKPDKDAIATALEVAHNAVYTLSGYDSGHFNDFSPSTIKQSTVAGAGGKLLQVDCRFTATPVL